MRIFSDLKLIIRSLARNKVVTSLNILGLTVGLSVSLLIFIFVINQNSIDRFIPNINKIYSLTNNGQTYLSQNEINLIKDEIPDIDEITYCSEDWSSQVFLKTGEKSFKTEKILTADSCFFRVFAFKTVYGNPATALNTSNKLVLTRSFSEKIFGSKNPVGKTLTYNASYLQGEILEVAAVIEDLPSTSSWDFNAVLSFQTNYKIGWYVSNMNHWGTRNYKAFVRINKTLSQEQVLAKLRNLPMNHVPEHLKESFNLNLFPFSKVYFDLPELAFLKHGNRLTVSIIGITGILILLLACINYVNMVTAQREKRNKTIGIIKIMGGNRNKIIQIITAESFIQVVLAGILSILIIGLIIPVFNRFTSLNLSASDILKFHHLILTAAIFILIVVITGVVPGVLFSKKIPLPLIKQQNNSTGVNTARNSLLVFQFTVTIALIASILIVNKQNNFLQNKNLGFDKSQIVYAYTNDALLDKAKVFKNEIGRISGVSDLTYSENVLVDNSQNWGRKIVNKGEKEEIHFSKLSVAPNFFRFFGINIHTGRAFDENSHKKQEFIFNKTAQKQFNIENINEAQIATSKPENGMIAGIIEDYNFESLHVPIRAAGFMCSGDFDEVVYLKLNCSNPGEFEKTIKEVVLVWNQLSPDFPLEYQYLERKWKTKYMKDQQFQKIISYTTLVSILLSCLGLIGLTFFVMEQRTKEIGIRKVNGAKTIEVMSMLNMGIIKRVAIAFVIACPIAWYAMHKWLENFAYKTELSWWIFAMAGVIAMGIALLTVSFQSWRAATRNPVESLRYE